MSKKINLNIITPDNISKNTATTPQYGHFTKIKSCIVTKLIMCYNWVNKNYFPSFSLHIINCYMCFNIKCWLILSSCYTSFELFFLFLTEFKIEGFNCTLTTFRSNSFPLFSASFCRLSRFLFLFTSFNLLCFRLSFASSCYNGSWYKIVIENIVTILLTIKALKLHNTFMGVLWKKSVHVFFQNDVPSKWLHSINQKASIYKSVSGLSCFVIGYLL